MNKFAPAALIAAAAILALASCATKAPKAPDASNAAAIPYFTQSSIGLMPGETAATELRIRGRQLQNTKNRQLRNAKSQNAPSILYTIADPAIATVDARGRVTALSEGRTTLTAKIQVGGAATKASRATKTTLEATLCIRTYPRGHVRYVCPTGDRFPIFGYHTVMTERRDFEVMEECGLNIAMTTCSAEENLQVLKNLEGLQMKIAPYATRSLTPERAVELFSQHPNFGLYYINDEPSYYDGDEFPALARQLQKLDPAHLCYLNLLPIAESPQKYDTTRYGPDGYQAYLAAELERNNASFLSYDHYPVYVDPATKDTVVRKIYFRNIAEIAQAAKEFAIPFWAYTNSIEHWKYPYPEEGHMRLQLFANLACGAQGFCYFEYSRALGEPAYKGALYNQETHEKERSWTAAQAINAELQAYAPYLQGGQMLYAMGPEGYEGANAYDAAKLPWPVRSVVAANGKYLVTHLCSSGHEYMAVVNCDPFAATEVRLEWERRPGRGSRIRKITKSGTLVRPSEVEPLPAGDILLYKLN